MNKIRLRFLTNFPEKESLEKKASGARQVRIEKKGAAKIFWCAVRYSNRQQSKFLFAQI